MFSTWLHAQRDRSDDVGRFAALVLSDRNFPRRSHRLYIILRYCGTNGALRRIAKIAHAEWRETRKVKAVV